MKKLLGTMLLCTIIASACNAAIIISQYYEGTSFNKWIEIFNSGSAGVDLTAGSYQLGQWNNASRQGWKTGVAPNFVLALSNTIGAAQCFIYAHSAAVLPAYATSIANTRNSSVINFNGDDSVVLYTGSSYNSANIVDAFGVTVTTTTGSPFVDTSYSRKTTISTGVNTDFNATDWVKYTLAQVEAAGSTEIAYISYHTIPEPALVLMVPVAVGLLLRRK